MNDTVAQSQPDDEALYQLASTSAGYFTARQARAAGYGWALLGHHVGRGRFRRVARGLYRLRDYPSSEHEELVAAQLRLGPDAVISHVSALDAFDLTDVIPDAVHITVPRARRGIGSLPGVQLHTTERPMEPSDLVRRGPLVLTSPARAIIDAAINGLDPSQVAAAVRQAVDRGLVTSDGLRVASRGASARVRDLITQALGSA